MLEMEFWDLLVYKDIWNYGSEWDYLGEWVEWEKNRFKGKFWEI